MLHGLTNTDQGTRQVASTDNTVEDFLQHELFCIREQKTRCHRKESEHIVVPGICFSQ